MTQESVSQPIGLAELLDRIAAAIRRFVVVSEAQCYVLALWVLHTHSIEAADSTPYLSITSPEKQSGKSRLLEVLAQLVPRAMEAANVSDAALFRALGGENGPMTLLFDEVDSIFNRHVAKTKEEQRGLLNAGWRRGAVAWRCEGDGSRQTVSPYPVFGAKALAGIGELPETLADRSIPIRLHRRRADERVERGRYRSIVAVCESLKHAAEDWAQEHVNALRTLEPDLPDQLSDRAQDGAEPLLAIADLAGEEWPQRARRALVALHQDRPEESESWRIRLLTDIRTVIGDLPRITTADLLRCLRADEHGPWQEWGKGDDGLTPRGLANLLAPFDIRPVDLRTPSGTRKGYKREQFRDAWERYLPPVSREKSDKRDIALGTGETRRSASATKPSPSRIDHRHNAHQVADVADVAEGSRVEAGGGAKAKGETR